MAQRGTRRLTLPDPTQLCMYVIVLLGNPQRTHASFRNSAPLSIGTLPAQKSVYKAMGCHRSSEGSEKKEK